MMKRKDCPKTWDEDVDALARAKFYLLSRNGPLIFKLKDANDSSCTVCIASPSHRCSCGGGEAKGFLCIHILFVVIKILRVPHLNPLAWASSWSADAVDRILAGRHLEGKNTSIHTFLRKGDGARKAPVSAEVDTDTMTENEASVAQRELGVCSICQDDMTESELNDELLCYCEHSCGISFHRKCMRIYAAHAKMGRKKVSCPMCRAPWTASLAASAASGASQNDKDNCKPTRRRFRCTKCRLTIRTQIIRCASCPSLDLCQSCFRGGASLCHDTSHALLMGDVSKNPIIWKAVGRQHNTTSSNQRDDRERLSLLQYRDLSSADYHELLALDEETSDPPLHKHLVNALPTVVTSDYPGQKCPFCQITLTVDRTAKKFPCSSQHVVHQTCAMNVILSALAASECGGAAAANLICPCCPVSDEKTTFLFPSLLREPEHQPARKTDTSTGKQAPPFDVTNLNVALDRCLTVTANNVPAIKVCPLSITGVTQNNIPDKGRCATATENSVSAIKVCPLSITGVTQSSISFDKQIKHETRFFQRKRSVREKMMPPRTRVAPYKQPDMMMLSGINYAKRQQLEHPKQIERSRNIQDRKRSNYVTMKRVSIDKGDWVPSNLRITGRNK